MTDDHDDDEALAWAGDEPLRRVEPVETSPTSSSDETAPSTQMPAALLVTYGILAGIYLIYTLGWIITITRSTFAQSDLLAAIMFQFGQFLAIASPAIWFVSILYLTRGRKPTVRLLLLVAGLVATIPWPLLLGK